MLATLYLKIMKFFSSVETGYANVGAPHDVELLEYIYNILLFEEIFGGSRSLSDLIGVLKWLFLFGRSHCILDHQNFSSPDVNMPDI